MQSKRRTFISETLRAVAVIGLATALGLGNAHADDKKTLTIGATAGSNFDQLKLGIKPVLEKKGYTVKLVEFNDYVQPNLALAQGSLDANLFQHVIYLKKFSADKGLNLVDITKAPIAPLGLYSKKRRSLADLRDGDRITLPNDPSNLARALVFLEQNKLIKVKAGVDPLKVTEKDVAENPRKLVLTPIEAARMELVNGLPYVSMGGGGPQKAPPPWLMNVMVKLMPSLRRSERRLREVLTERPWLGGVAQWYATDRPRAISRLRGLAEVQPDALDDAGLALHLESVDLELRGCMRQHILLHAHDTLPPGLFVVAAERWGLASAEATALLTGASPASTGQSDELTRLRAATAGAPVATLDELRALGPDAAGALDEFLLIHGWRLVDS